MVLEHPDILTNPVLRKTQAEWLLGQKQDPMTLVLQSLSWISWPHPSYGIQAKNAMGLAQANHVTKCRGIALT